MIFDMTIAEKMLRQVKRRLDLTQLIAQEQPVLIILGGQPASGKSSAIYTISNQLENNIIALNGDDYKSYYPGYQNLLAEDSDATSKIVQPYSNYVVDSLKKELMSFGHNILIEGTMRTAKTPIDTAEEFKSSGYKVEAYVVASNYYASRVGCVRRCEREIATTGSGRSVLVEAHDEAYANIPNTIRELNKSGLFDSINIVSRDGTILAQSKNNDDIVGIYTEQRIVMPEKLFNDICANLTDATEMKLLRNAPLVELESLRQLKVELESAYKITKLITLKTSGELLKQFQVINPEQIDKLLLKNFVTYKEKGNPLTQVINLENQTKNELCFHLMKSNNITPPKHLENFLLSKELQQTNQRELSW